MSDLARHLGKNWNQCHEWIVKRNHKPSAEVALGMMDFIAINDKSNSRNIEHKATDGFSELFVDGRKLTELERDLWIENNMLKTMIASQIGKHDKG